MKQNKIGIVGGLGPYAGLDLAKKIFDLSDATTDQDQYDLCLISYSSEIPDRTEFILNKIEENPAEPIFKVIQLLERTGASVIGIPCNTSHADVIFAPLMDKIQNDNLQVTLLDMIYQVGRHIKSTHKNIKRVGILSTTGTVASKVYTTRLKLFDLDVIYPDTDTQNLIHESIYNKEFGIKANSIQISDSAIKLILKGAEHLIEREVECIVLACTELPLAIQFDLYKGIPIIDSTQVLAKALINQATMK